VTPPTGVPLAPAAESTALFSAVLDIAGTVDRDQIEPAVLRAATSLLAADGASFWVAHDGALACPIAIGHGASELLGKRTEQGELGAAFTTEQSVAVATSTVEISGQLAGVIRVARDSAAGGPFSPGEREVLARLAAAAAIALRNAASISANDRAKDLALVMEMSREIASTLDLDRVMQSVVNLAMKAVPFDRGAIALYERGHCDIRAVAGAEKVDPDDPELQDLAARAAWAAGIGEGFFVSDRTEPASDAERTFLHVFGDDLADDGVMSGLYIPLKDDEGVVGILVLESAHADFANPRQQELATILANQATVAMRNAQLYNQVPLADALGALHARKEALFALPRQRRIAWAVLAVLLLGAA
jgi:GAF domain-containing protein